MLCLLRLMLGSPIVCAPAAPDGEVPLGGKGGVARAEAVVAPHERCAYKSASFRRPV